VVQARRRGEVSHDGVWHVSVCGVQAAETEMYAGLRVRALLPT
jgi:hypothetical protein